MAAPRVPFTKIVPRSRTTAKEREREGAGEGGLRRIADTILGMNALNVPRWHNSLNLKIQVRVRQPETTSRRVELVAVGVAGTRVLAWTVVHRAPCIKADSGRRRTATVAGR